MKSYAPYFLLLTLLLFSCKKANGNDPIVLAEAIKEYKAQENKNGVAGDKAIDKLKSKIRNVDAVFASDQLTRLGDTLLEKNDYTVAYRCYRLSIELVKSKNNDESKFIIGYNKLKMAQLEQQVGDYHSSQRSATLAFTFFKDIEHDHRYDVELNNIIGISFEFLGDYESALKHYSKVNKLPNDEINHIILDNNIAHIYALEKKV